MILLQAVFLMIMAALVGVGDSMGESARESANGKRVLARKSAVCRKGLA